MNTFNVLIHGNYSDIRGDAAIYMLERVRPNQCNIWFSGTTVGMPTSSVIISNALGNYTASINGLGWTGSGTDIINSACQSSSPKIDLIIYPELEGDWSNWQNAAITASNYGIPVFTPHFSDTSSAFSVNQFYGFSPTVLVGWGNYLTKNSGSYGNQFEFFDTVLDGKTVSSSIVLQGNVSGLLQAENLNYFNNNEFSTNALFSPVSTAAKYINLCTALSASYSVNSGSQNVQIYTNYRDYLNTNNLQSRKQFNFDVRQYFRQISTVSSSGWTPQQGFGMIQISNYTGSAVGMQTLTSSYNLSTLGAGTPMYITVTSQSVGGPYTFNWQNFAQSGFKDTIVKINNNVVYQGTDTSYTWIPDVTVDSATVKFYTSLFNGNMSSPEGNSIIILNGVTSQVGNFLKLNYGYSCADNGTYIAIGSVNNDPSVSLSGLVDVLKYNKTTNEYDNKFIIKKLVNPSDYFLILAAESGSLDVNDNSIDSAFLMTELSSSFDVSVPVSLGTEQAGSSQNHIEIQTESGNDLYVTSSLDAYNNDSLNIEVDSVFNLISSYSDKFGQSLSLYGSLLAVGCPNYTITFKNGDVYNGGSADIFDLESWTSGSPYYPIASVSSEGDASYGESVSLSQVQSGSLYLAVGSSTAFNGYGAVYIYERQAEDNTNWELIQTIYGPQSGSFFGGKVRFEQSGKDYTLVVGNSNKSNLNTAVTIFSKNGDLWEKNVTLVADHSITQTLPYLNGLSPVILTNAADGFGNSVAIYGDNIVIGSPTDTLYTEFEGGISKYRGAVYFYHRCTGVRGDSWEFAQKSWGDIETLVNNEFGYDVDINSKHAVVTVPKHGVNFTSKYILNTLDKRINCNPNDSYFDTLGQVVIFNHNVLESKWDIFYTQQKTKDYGYPYINYGYCIALYDESFVVGAPCLISDYRLLTPYYPNVIQGYSYVYNLNNLITNHPVGNVFYRDGKIILSNSGSIFDSLMKDKYDGRFSAYDLTYTGTLRLYEKQIVCSINPKEFNFSTNPTSLINNKFFGFKDVDLLLKYANNIINGNQYWWNYLQFNVVEQSLFNMYVENYDIVNTTIDSYYNQLSSSYLKWDVDGNNKINIKDMTLIWKYFTNTLTQDDVFMNVEPKSKRKTLTDIQNYIQNNVIVKRYGEINPKFFEYDYSSSIDPTGSYLAPYITTIGLYNGADLVAVAKLAQPIKNGGEFPLNILVKWDF
jgi:hypothetical protein